MRARVLACVRACACGWLAGGRAGWPARRAVRRARSLACAKGSVCAARARAPVRCRGRRAGRAQSAGMFCVHVLWACTEHARQRPPAGNAVVSRHDGRPRPLDDSAVVLGVHKTSALDESQSQNLGNKKRSARALCARARTLPRMWSCIAVRIFRPQPLLTSLVRTINFCRRPSCKVHTSTSHMIKPSEISRSNSRSLCSGIAVSSMSRSVRTSISLLELFHHLERMAILQ